MIKTFLSNFKKLPDSNKSMIYLMWIYSAGGIISGLFINIYVFSLQKDILDVLIYNAIFFLMTFIGFSGVGFLMSILRKNIKNMYYFAYTFFILAFLMIFLVDGYIGVYLFALIYGLGNGIFRCAVHTQELVNIKDKTRDIYSSIISSGTNIISIVVPLIVSLIFFVIGKFFNFDPYIFLFLFLPIVYVVSFLFIHNIGDYVPSKIKMLDFTNFFNLKKYLFGQLYFIFVGFYQGLFWSLLPTIAIILLKTEINVGLFEGIISLISTFLIIFLSNKRSGKNRIKVMGILSFLLFINLVIFSFNFNIYGYIFFTLVALFLNPLYRVSEHVFDLKLMDTIKVKGSDFFPAMILREFSLWIGRMIVIFSLIYLVILGTDLESVLKIGLFSIGIFLILAWSSIVLHMKFENEENI